MNLHALRCVAPNWVALILLLCSWGVSCKNRVAAEDQQFQMLFNGFQLVTVDKLPPNVRTEDLNPANLQNAYPTERTLVPDRVYVFRKTTGTSNEDLGMKVLPDRLRSIGARVTKAPQNSKDFMYVYVGGPLFVIEFEKDGHHGTMLNRVHTSQNSNEQWEELIVAYK